MKIDTRTALAASGLWLLAACGGGGSDNNNPTPTPPPAQDTTPPTITLTGDAAVDLVYGSVYSDEGATATDDTDTTVNVSSTGSVDPFTAGTYTITYEATDAAGNTATAERLVTVASQQFRLDISNFGDAQITLSDGSVTCNAGGDVCSATLDAGSSVTVTAAPATGWTFDSWINCDTVAGNQCTITMDEDSIVFATSTSDAAVTLQADVVILSDAQIDSILNYNASSDILFFAAGSDVGTYPIGTVIVSQGSAANDIYFGKRIVDIIALAGSPIIVETVNVSLDEIVASGTILATADISPSSVNEAALPAGMSIDKTAAAVSADAIPLVVVGLPIFDANGVSLTVTGDVVVDFDPNIAAQFTATNGLEAFRFAGASSVDANLALSISGEIDTLLSLDEELSLGVIPVGTVIAGPAVFLIELEPIVTLNSALEVTIEPSVTVQQVSALGAQWHRQSGWTNLSDFSISGDVVVPETPSASFSADIGGGLKPTAKLYGLAGPFLKSTIYGGAEYSLVPSEDCLLNFREYIGGRASAGGEFGRVGRRLTLETLPVFVEFNIDSGTIDCPVDSTAPSAPSALAASPFSDSEIKLSWATATDNIGVVSYEVWRRDSNGARPHFIAETSGLEYLDGGLPAETEFCYYVISVDAAGNKSDIPLDLVCATTLEDVDSELPTVPSGLAITDITSSSMLLSWDASTDNDAVTGYTVFDDNIGAAYGSVGASASPQFSAGPLNPDTEYCYSVAAIDASGNQSLPSQSVCATTEPAANAAWTVFLGCVGLPFQLQQNFDLPLAGISPVEIAGAGTDYDGTPLSYVFQGVFDANSSDLQSDIIWAFEGQAQQRIDRFNANLATGDSGVVTMNQIQVTGCTAQIQIIANEGAAPVSVGRPVKVSVSGAASGDTLGGAR